MSSGNNSEDLTDVKLSPDVKGPENQDAKDGRGRTSPSSHQFVEEVTSVVGEGHEDALTEEDLGDDVPHAAESPVTPKPTEVGSSTLRSNPNEDSSDDIGSSTPVDLDALLSPTLTSGPFSARQSVAASETTDDDTRFSTVPLSSARQSLVSDLIQEEDEEDIASTSLNVDDDAVHDERRDTLDGSELIRLVHTNRTHKKTASTSTIVSGIVSRLEGDDTLRTSMDGHQKLQEEFGKKHETLITSGSDSDIDWRTCSKA